MRRALHRPRRRTPRRPRPPRQHRRSTLRLLPTSLMRWSLRSLFIPMLSSRKFWELSLSIRNCGCSGSLPSQEIDLVALAEPKLSLFEQAIFRISERVVAPTRLIGRSDWRSARQGTSRFNTGNRCNWRRGGVGWDDAKIRSAGLPSQDSAVRPSQVPVSPPADMITGVIVDVRSTDPRKTLTLQRKDSSFLGEEGQCLTLFPAQCRDRHHPSILVHPNKE